MLSNKLASNLSFDNIFKEIADLREELSFIIESLGSHDIILTAFDYL